MGRSLLFGPAHPVFVSRGRNLASLQRFAMWHHAAELSQGEQHMIDVSGLVQWMGENDKLAGWAQARDRAEARAVESVKPK